MKRAPISFITMVPTSIRTDIVTATPTMPHKKILTGVIILEISHQGNQSIELVYVENGWHIIVFLLI